MRILERLVNELPSDKVVRVSESKTTYSLGKFYAELYDWREIDNRDGRRDEISCVLVTNSTPCLHHTWDDAEQAMRVLFNAADSAGVMLVGHAIDTDNLFSWTGLFPFLDSDERTGQMRYWPGSGPELQARSLTFLQFGNGE